MRAAAAGPADAAGTTRAETVAPARAPDGRGLLLTVDIESGFAGDPDAVASCAAATRSPTSRPSGYAGSAPVPCSSAPPTYSDVRRLTTR